MMTKPLRKKILVFIDWYLPGYKAGGPVRSMANMVGHLSDRFDFFIVTRNTEYGEREPYATVRSDAWTPLSQGVSVWYASRGGTSFARWRRLIREVNPEVVYINGIYSPHFSLCPLLAARSMKHPRIMVAPRGMLAGSAIGVKRGKKTIFLKMAVRVGLYNGVHWHVTNEAEGHQVAQLFGVTDAVTIAANLPRKEVLPSVKIDKSPGVLRLCCPARIAPEKNTLYAIECLRKLPTGIRVALDLYGQIYNETYWAQCMDEMARLPQEVTVLHKGLARPEEIGNTLARYHLLFLPSRGENFGHVILESLMAGRPVLISDQTPWQGLAHRKAGVVLPLSNQQAFADVITRFAQCNQDSFDEWVRGAGELGKEVAGDPLLPQQYATMFQGE